MRHELRRDVDIYYVDVAPLTIHEGEPLIDEKIGMRRTQYPGVKNIRQGDKAPHQSDKKDYYYTEKAPSERFQMVPEGHFLHYF